MGYLVFILLGLFLFFNTDILAPARSLIGFMVEFTWKFPFMLNNGTNQAGTVWGTGEYPLRIGPFVVYLGVLGFLSLPFVYLKYYRRFLLPIIIFSTLTLMLYIGSRQTLVSNPDRLARDLIMPLSIYGGAFIASILESAHKLNKSIFVILLVTFFVLIARPVTSRAEDLMARNTMVRISDVDKDAVKFLKEKGSSKRLLVVGWNVYVEIFLSDWHVHLYSPLMTKEEIMSNNDYLYVIDYQKGWVPRDTLFGLPESIKNNPLVVLDKQYLSDDKNISIYQIKEPPKELPKKKPSKRKFKLNY